MKFKTIFYILIVGWSVALFPQNTDDFEKEIDAEVNAANQKKESNQGAQDSSNRLDMAAVVDTVGSWRLDETAPRPEGVEDSFYVREAALAIFNDIDHLARGTLRLNAETEDGLDYEVGIEEAYFEMLTLPYGLYAKFGKFLADAGRLNSIHRHAWNFTHAPLVHESLFGEGINDAGAEVSLLMPWSFYQELRLGLFNGSGIGKDTLMNRKSAPMVTARLKHFFPIGERWGTQFGFTGIRYAPDKDKGNYNAYYGFDFMLKWKKNNLRSFSITTELWQKDEYLAAKLADRRGGGYVSLNWQFLQTWMTGVRYDIFGPLKLTNTDREASLWLTWKPSGFAYYRAQVSRQDILHEKEQYVARVQADFVVGYHPAHKY